MENEPSLLDVADEEFAQINKPEQKQDKGSILDIADDEFKKQEEESNQKEFDVAKLEKLKAEGKPLSEVQQRMIFDEQDKVPLLQQAGSGIKKFFPLAATQVGELSRGAYELAREGAVKPVYVGAKYHLGLATPKETNIAARDAEIALRSGVSGFMSDLEDTAGTIIKGYESGSSFTDKLQGLSADERFKRYRWRERFQGYQQARRDETPDRAAAVLAENELLQKAAGIAAKMQGGNEEDAKAAEKAYSELVLESGLTREELNPYISSLGEFISPISIPGANIATKTIGKYTGKAVQKGGELALKRVVKPVAAGVEKAAELTEKGITGVQTGARKLGEYVTGDPDTLIRGGSIAGLISAPQITGTILAAKPAAIATKQVARTFKDIASQVDVGGAAGRRGLVERAGRSADSGALTKRLFSAESRGGLGRAKAADWMIRQGNAITQQGVNGAVLNTILGLPDIESIEQGFEVAGSGFGMGAFGGSRIMDRAGALIDPRTGLAQKIDTIITPDPSSRRADEDADIKRFLSSVDPDLVPRMEKLGSIDERKKAIQTKIDDLEKKKDVTFGPDVQDIKSKISKLKTTIETLDKATPQTQKEILRQVHLAFAEEMDLAKTTGKAAGLNNIQVKILDPSEMEGFFRNSYGATLTDAESVISQLTGNPNLSPQESESLVNARKVVDRFYNEVGSLQSARGAAISDGSETPAFMRKQNLQGATIVINGDLVKQLSGEGFNVRNVVGHEMQHALSQFSEVRDMLAPIRRELFDQNIVNDDGTINKVTQGVYSDEKLDAYADTYAAAMSPSDNGESFKAQFGDQDKLRAYIKEEVLSEIAGRSGRINGGKRAGLDSIGRQVVDWIEVKTQNGVLKTIKETLRKGGIIVDDSGDISTVLGAELTPESLAMIRQYQRQLNNLNQSMVYEGDARKEEVEIPLTKILSDRSLQEKFKNSDIFEKEQVATMTAPDGSKQEIPLPPEAGVDPFVGTYRIQGGQLVDEKGIPMNLGPEITFGTMPDGTQVEVGTRIARNVDGSPKILSNREIEARSRNRGKVIRNAIDSALSKGALQLEDTGNGNYRGVMSETQVNAVLALPNTIVSPNLKRQILFVNEILRRKDGTRMYMEYQAAMRGGKSRALAPQIRDEIPIGFQFSKQGNFLITTISVSRMHDKMNAWLAKKPENLKLWNGDTTEFWSDVIKVLDNHSKGDRGETGLDTDAAVALEKKNAVNDLFNVWNADTKAANPRRTKLPVQKGKDPIDVIVRSRRIDRINQYNESALQKMPFNYELNRDNYMPAENPLADFQTPEDFANDLPSVTAEEIRNAINTGNLDQLESKLREGDDLKPAESLDEENGNIRIVSMFDPAFMPEDPMESEPEVSVSATQFMPAETERYPTSERGMYSGLQKTIDEKVTGKFASPDQLKAIVNNPQNAKAEELKWSGVLGEIDRLAAENQGKVPKDKVMDYLRNEGAVKFEEVTLGQNNSIQKIADEYRIKIEDEYGEKAFYDEFDDPLEFDELPIRLQDAIDQSKNAPEPKHSTYQLPGGANYREVVMTMPIPPTKRKNWGIIYDSTIGRAQLGVVFKTKEEAQSHIDNHPDIKNPKVNSWDFEEESKPSYTSSHFPDTPNYVAHMRINERTDAQGNKGDFVEEFQSDRHQAGREKGYQEDFKPLSAEEKKRLDIIGDKVEEMEMQGAEGNPTPEYEALYSETLNLMRRNQGGAIDSPPDAPFRKDWSIQLFKRALRDAVDADKSWIGWTTGIEQVKRYENAMRQAVDEIVWEKPGAAFKNFRAYKNGNSVFGGSIDEYGRVLYSSTDADGNQLSEVVGKEIATKILAQNSGTAKGNDLTVGGEGMKGFYDQIMPKEVGKYVAKMGGKVEKSEIEAGKKYDFETVQGFREGVFVLRDRLTGKFLADIEKETFASRAEDGQLMSKKSAESYAEAFTKDTSTPIWRVNITPEMAGKVRGGQLQFMPADSEYLNLAKDPEKNREKLQRMVDDAAILMIKSFPISKNDNDVPNIGSIAANGGNFQSYGVREVPTNLFSGKGKFAFYNEKDQKRVDNLTEDIKQNGVVSPLIVVIDGDKDGDAYVMEGSHRIAAIEEANLSSFPALVLRDKGASPLINDDQGNVIPLSQRFQTTGLQFMPAVQTIPERFTGTGKKGEERRGRYVAPPEFWTRFDIGEFNEGGKFFDLETGEDITNKNYATGTIDASGKRPSLVSDSLIDEMPDEQGRTWKTNLFRKSAGWDWISENPPEVAAIGSKEKPNPVLISVENNPDHFYSLKVDFPNGVKLARYPEGGEPRLRPTKKGQIKFGNEVGRIKTSRGKEHIVYDSITIGQPQFMPADSEYLNLAKDPEKNREKLQGMVDQAAKSAGYNIKAYRGASFDYLPEDKYSFPPDETYFTQSKSEAEFHKNKFKDDAGREGKLYEVYIKSKKPYIVEDYEDIESWAFSEAVPELKKQGYDSVGYKEKGKFLSIVPFYSENIKSADPITYDDEGNVIPLSQRFQTTFPDIRFMPSEELPTKYEPISARIRPLEGISAPTKVVGAKGLSLGEIEPPVRGKAMLPDMELTPDSSEKSIQSSDKTGLQFMPAEGDQPTKKYAFSYTTSSDRIPLVAELVKAKNWQAIRDLNQATIRHAMSDLPDVKYTMRDLVGAFENEREISVMPEFEINTPEELAEVRKRMISLGELWQQTEVLEEQVDGGDQSILGTTDTDGYLHIGKYVLTFDKLTPALVEKARKASGIQAMSYDNNSVIFYDTDNNPAEFDRRVTDFRKFVTSNGRVLENWSTTSSRVRSYRNPRSPKEGSLYYNEDPVRLFGEGQLPDRLRSPVYRVVSELLGRPLDPPKDGRSSYFVKEDVTPKQVKLQNAIANKQAAVVLNDKKNKDVIKAYDELNAELVKQFDALVAGGMTFNAASDYDAYNGLYPDSASVIRDIRNNNNLVYLKTTPETFGPVQNGKRMDFSFHPILKDSGRTDASGNKMSYNDILRVVHDAIAHGIYSAQFGPVGEESAWNTHIRTIDNPWARWALTMETRAQNSWVNYQDKFLTEKKTGVDRMPLKKGDKGYIPVPARDYAEQKFALIPLKYALTGDAKIDKPVKDLIEEIGEKRADGSPEKDPEWMPSKQEREKIYASIKQPQGTPKDLLKQASDVIGKLTKKDNAENVPVIVEKAWVEKKSKDEDAEDETDDSVEDGEVIMTSTAVLKDVVVYSLKGTPIVVRPLPNLLAENVKTKVSKSVISIAKDKEKYLEYTRRVVTAADKLRKDPEMFTTTSGYLEFMRESGASGNLLMPPSQIVQLVKNAKEIVQLWQGGYHGKKTAPGTIAAAVDGLDSVNAMRDLFIQDGVNLGPTRMITALHHLWGILSRQLDPYNQEALWMRMVSYAPVMEQIQLSIDGKFKLTADEWKKIVQDARRATKGDYQKAGNNATANANAFHHMLSKHNGKWQELANIYKLSDPVEMTNAFWGLGVGATGIKNKVQRFIGLTFGIHGSVLDRWRFVGLNLPTAMRLTGKATPETYFNYYGRNKTIPEDPVGIYKSYGTVENGNPVFSTALYAGIDRTIQGVIDNSKEMRDFLGVHATPGGFHWVDWNCVKNEAVGHSSLDLTKEFLKRKGRNGTVEDFLDVVRTSETFTRADQDGRIIDLVMKNGIFQVVEKK